jgi:hypothetical protein
MTAHEPLVLAGLAADLRHIARLLERDHDLPGAERENRPQARAQSAAVNFLVDTFGLSPFERDVVLMCAGMELDADCAAIVSRVQDGGPPTFALALSTLRGAHWSALLPTGPLRSWRLIELIDGPSLVGSGLRIDERILHLLTETAYLDDRLRGIVEILSEAGEIVASHRLIAERLAATWTAADGEGERPVIQLCGPDLSAHREIAASACMLVDSNLLLVRAQDLADTPESLELVQRLLDREALLTGGVLMIVCDDPAGADPSRHRRLEGFIDRALGPLILSGRERRPQGRWPMVSYDIAKPTLDEQFEIWTRLLDEAGAHGGFDVRALAYQFDLTASGIRAVGLAALAGLAADEDGLSAPPELREKLWDSCRLQARPRMDEVVERIEPSATWRSLVLPECEERTVRAILDQVRHRSTVYGEWGFSAEGARGLGISALFAGPSGTGKTLAAEVLASELRLDLYRIDLSAVVNKYIGETEKNLRRVFDAAEAGGAILLFDEADALFGKRSEVKDSHDRHSNIEVSYLLQRFESYRGLAILTTNLKDSIDQAFLRRLRFVVQFPFPDATTRRRIWEGVFPPSTPQHELDFERLAQLNIAGGSIRNIALNAAFFAAARGSGVAMRDVRAAALTEYSKLEKTLTTAETKGWE